MTGRKSSEDAPLPNRIAELREKAAKISKETGNLVEWASADLRDPSARRGLTCGVDSSGR